MNRITSIKLALVVVSGIFFLAGMRTDNPTLRLIGIGVLVVAFALRFIKTDKSA